MVKRFMLTALFAVICTTMLNAADVKASFTVYMRPMQATASPGDPGADLSLGTVTLKNFNAGASGQELGDILDQEFKKLLTPSKKQKLIKAFLKSCVSQWGEEEAAGVIGGMCKVSGKEFSLSEFEVDLTSSKSSEKSVSSKAKTTYKVTYEEIVEVNGEEQIGRVFVGVSKVSMEKAEDAAYKKAVKALGEDGASYCQKHYFENGEVVVNN